MTDPPIPHDGTCHHCGQPRPPASHDAFCSTNCCREHFGIPVPPKSKSKYGRGSRHGTESRYVYYRCRCEPCRQASNEGQRRRRAQRRELQNAA